jgi:hypothetical protein
MFLDNWCMMSKIIFKKYKNIILIYFKIKNSLKYNITSKFQTQW